MGERSAFSILRAVVEVGTGTSDRYLEPLNEHGPNHGALIPCGDDSLEFIADNRMLLEEMGYTPI